MKNRNEILDKYKWKISDIFSDESEWEKEFEKVKNQLDFSSFVEKLKDDKILLEFLTKSEEVEKSLSLLDVYAMMKKDEDSSLSDSISRQYKIDALITEYSFNTAFAYPEMTAFSEEKLNSLINNPSFCDYDRFFGRILKNKPHVLSEESEKILALGGQVFSSFKNIFDMADNVDFPFPEIDVNGEKIIVTHAEYGALLQNQNRAVREKAFKAYYNGYKKLLNVISSTYISSVNKDVFLAKARNYTSALQKSTFSEEVSPEIYQKLLSKVNGALPVLHDYVAKRKQELNLDEMHMWDMYVPIVSEIRYQKSYEQAFETVKKGLSVLGNDYCALLNKAYNEGWIDVMENYGKRSGAYSVGVYGIKHPFVLLNYQGVMHDTFTIAHELGHSMHTYFSNLNQTQSKADYTIFVAEVASTVNEVLLLKSMLRNEKDLKIKRYLLNYYLEMIRTTLFRQTMFAEFEFAVHDIVEKGGALSKDELSKIYLELNQKYYGSSVVSDEEISFEWARIPHFYSAFYVYKYATGIISAITIADKILSGEKNAVENYFKFLSSGCSDTPVNLLKIAGVHLDTDEPYDLAMKSFKDALDEFIKLGEENG